MASEEQVYVLSIRSEHCRRLRQDLSNYADVEVEELDGCETQFCHAETVPEEDLREGLVKLGYTRCHVHVPTNHDVAEFDALMHVLASKYAGRVIEGP